MSNGSSGFSHAWQCQEHPECPCVPMWGCPTGVLVAPRATHRQPVSALLLLSAELQGGAGADWAAEPRQYGECLSPSVGTTPAHTVPFCGHTLGTPASTLPVVQVDKRIPTLPPAPSPSPARPPQGAPLPPPASLPPPHVAMVFCLPQCFMNSILQCLSNTKELRDYCLQNQYLRDLNNNSRMRTALMSGIRGGGEGGQDGDSCGVHPSPPPSPYR